MPFASLSSPTDDPLHMQDYLLIAAGLVTLVVGADFLVRGSVWCALTLGISPMLVGLTLVAFGTSAPELVVSLSAALKDSPGIATGTALGSNIANIGLIIGIAALIQPIVKSSNAMRFEVNYMVFAALLPLLILFQGTAITRTHGLLLLGILLVFTVQLGLRESRRRKVIQASTGTSEDRSATTGSAPRMLLSIALGGAGLYYGGGWLVDGASGVARNLGMGEVAIGITVIAVGTSLPELVTSLLAARRGHPEIALGNVLGSNIFNICMVLGATAMIKPLPISWHDEGPTVILGIGMAIFLAILLKRGVSRGSGATLLIIYLAYMAYVFTQRQ